MGRLWSPDGSWGVLWGWWSRWAQGGPLCWTWSASGTRTSCSQLNPWLHLDLANVSSHVSQPRDFFEQSLRGETIEGLQFSELHPQQCRTRNKSLGALADKAEGQAAFRPSSSVYEWLSLCRSVLCCSQSQWEGNSLLWALIFCIRCEAHVSWGRCGSSGWTHTLKGSRWQFALFFFFFFVFSSSLNLFS